jgi:hypothetical protein
MKSSLLIIDQGVEVSDTTGDATSTAAGNINPLNLPKGRLKISISPIPSWQKLLI